MATTQVCPLVFESGGHFGGCQMAADRITHEDDAGPPADGQRHGAVVAYPQRLPGRHTRSQETKLLDVWSPAPVTPEPMCHDPHDPHKDEHGSGNA